VQAFHAFTKDAFTQIRDAKVTTLIIDVRENTGGNDDMWKFGVLPYLADKPFRNGSSYLKKVIAGERACIGPPGHRIAGQSIRPHDDRERPARRSSQRARQQPPLGAINQRSTPRCRK
jgi:hypothetical protein